MSLAYWGPELGGFFPTQPALSIDLDAATNVTGMNFSSDGLAARQYIVTILEKHSKSSDPDSDSEPRHASRPRCRRRRRRR